MKLPVDFARDTEFQKLLSRREDVDLTIAALELARDAQPDLDFQPVRDWITARAAELSGPCALASSETAALAELGRCIAGQHGVTGNRSSYDHAAGSFLNEVIARKSGIPISLSVLYMAVAAEAGYTLQGVSAPGHFLTRYDSLGGPLFVDAFADGKILTLRECLGRMQSTAGLPRDTALAALQPVGPRTIIIRMLNNLKALYTRQSDWAAAWTVQGRLSALQPASYSERRDLALIAVKAQRPGDAVDLLSNCLQNCPEDELPVLEQQLAAARRQLALWN